MCKKTFYPFIFFWIFSSTFLLGCASASDELADSVLLENDAIPLAETFPVDSVLETPLSNAPPADVPAEDNWVAETQTEVADGVDISHRYKYKVRGKHYKVFNDAKSFQEIGIASWYGPGFHGKKTANGERYNMHAMTAAHKTLPLGSRVRVTNLENGKKITVRINDRGPFHNGRIIDLSKTAARKLGMLKKGFAKVHVKALK